jgi:hypothetical protein
MGLGLEDPWRVPTAPAAGPPPGGPAAGALRLAVPPLVVAGLLWWWGRPVAAAVLVAVVVAGVALRVVWRHGFERSAAALEGVARRVGSGAALLVTFVVAVPLLYLPGAAARGLRWMRGAVGPARTADTTWQEVGGQAERRRDATVPFAAPPRRVVRARHLASALVVAAVVVAVVVWDPGKPRVAPPAATRTPGTAERAGSSTTSRPEDQGSIADRLDAVPFSERPALAGVPFADELQRQTYRTDLVPDDATGYRLGDLSEPLVHVVDGRRATAPSSCTGCPAVDLWLAGGSLVFGIGQRDDHTIASELVALAARDGIALRVRNDGVPGWTVVQEGTALTAGDDRPGPGDVVVSLDGFNDAMAMLATVWADGEVPDGPVTLDAEKAELLLSGRPSAGDVGPTTIGRAAADRYAETAAGIDAQLADRGVRTFRFVQPDASATPVQRAAVSDLGVLPADFYQRTGIDRVMASFAAALEGRAVDLRTVFDGEADPVFLDTSHVNERGAARIAAALWRALEAPVRELAR